MDKMVTENPSSNTENMFNQVLVKDREVYLRYMGENGEPINLSDYVRKFMPDMREYDNETLMDVMCDDWGDEFVPLIYSLAVGFAEVRGRLAKYEDTGLMPDKVAALKAEIERLKAYRTAITIKPNEDGEYWCPSCNQQIVGYYASYCEYCGQCVEMEETP